MEGSCPGSQGDDSESQVKGGRDIECRLCLPPPGRMALQVWLPDQNTAWQEPSQGLAGQQASCHPRPNPQIGRMQYLNRGMQHLSFTDQDTTDAARRDCHNLEMDMRRKGMALEARKEEGGGCLVFFQAAAYADAMTIDDQMSVMSAASCLLGEEFSGITRPVFWRSMEEG